MSPLTSRTLDGTLALRRHAFSTLPNAYLARYRQHGDLPRYTESVTGFFEAAFGPSLWSSLDPGRGSDAQTPNRSGLRLSVGGFSRRRPASRRPHLWRGDGPEQRNRPLHKRTRWTDCGHRQTPRAYNCHAEYKRFRRLPHRIDRPVPSHEIRNQAVTAETYRPDSD